MIILLVLAITPMRQAVEFRDASEHWKDKTSGTGMPKPDPNISRIINQNCSHALYESYKVADWWAEYFSYEIVTPAMAPLQKFLKKQPAPTQEELESICFVIKEDHGYLYECHKKMEKCFCMMSPIHTQPITVGPKQVACLVDEHETCVAGHRPYNPPNSSKIQPYPCIPNWYCDTVETMKCKPCNNTKVDPMCPDPKPVKSASSECLRFLNNAYGVIILLIIYFTE